MECPNLPAIAGTARFDDAGDAWIDTEPVLLARAWIKAEVIVTQCQEALRVWRESWAQCSTSTNATIR